MTSTVITSSNSLTNQTQDVTGSGDDLLVASSGSIINTNAEDGIQSNNTDQAITIDGFVYSVDGNAGAGVLLSHESTNLFVNGQVQGVWGVWDYQTSDLLISVGSQGSIDGVGGDGEAGYGVYLFGSSSSPAATSNILSNAGDISASTYAVYATDGGGDSISNSGQMSGGTGVYLSSNVATETIENSGTITGVSTAIESLESTVGVDIVNSGTLTDSSANDAGGSVGAVLLFDDKSGTTSTIDNKGTITGSGYVIQSLSDGLDIANSGTIHGGL